MGKHDRPKPDVSRTPESALLRKSNSFWLPTASNPSGSAAAAAGPPLSSSSSSSSRRGSGSSRHKLGSSDDAALSSSASSGSSKLRRMHTMTPHSSHSHSHALLGPGPGLGPGAGLGSGARGGDLTRPSRARRPPRAQSRGHPSKPAIPGGGGSGDADAMLEKSRASLTMTKPRAGDATLASQTA